MKRVLPQPRRLYVLRRAGSAQKVRHTACALDSTGHVVAAERRLPTTVEALLDFLGALGGSASVAVEATLHWAWVHDQLTAVGYPVVVAHPQQVKLICHARCKADPIDAKKLADLLRTNLLPAIWVPDAETRARRPGPVRGQYERLLRPKGKQKATVALDAA